MKILLHDSDKTKFPNLALMKLSAAYKAQGHSVEWYAEGTPYDKVISSKVFTYTPEDSLPADTIKGGYGYNSCSLPDAVEHICPDYSLYGALGHSLGFLTRGCPNKCSWCFVPKREGNIRPHSDIMEFLRHQEVVCMDNNVLAISHGHDQIDKLARLGVKVDFNQGLDARLIDDHAAKRLSRLKWRSPLRMACDSFSQMEAVQKATTLLRWHNTTPRQYSCYVLIKDVEDAIERIKFLKGLAMDPFAQPFIDAEGTPATLKQKQLARWCNTKMLFRSMTFEAYIEERRDRV